MLYMRSSWIADRNGALNLEGAESYKMSWEEARIFAAAAPDRRAIRPRAGGPTVVPSP